MIWKRRGTSVATTVLVVAVSLAMLTLAGGALALVSARGTTGPTPSWGSHHTIVVLPNGVDDTADIQAAFNACVSFGPGCTVQLEKGTYYTAQITVYGFRGSFVGMGQGVTTIQALPNLPSPTANPFWTALPGPANPWPALFTFENGAYRISGMTITEPYYYAVSPGWNATCCDGLASETNLFDAFELTGVQAFATVDHVTVLGAPGDFAGTNMGTGINYEGTVLPQGWTNSLTDDIPISGTFSVTNSVFNSVEDGAWMDTIANTQVTVCYNTIVNSPVPLGFFDASDSQLTFCGNHASGVQVYTGFEGLQAVYRIDLPSTVYLTGNDFQVSDGANAVFLLDLGEADFGVASTLSAVVSGNVFQTDTSCGCYVGGLPSDYSVIISESLKSLVVSGNLILGGGSAGVYVNGGPGVVSGNTILGSYDGVNLNSTDGVHVTGNLIKNSAQWGIALTNESSYNVVAWNLVKNSGAYDLYWDGTGTDNTWAYNVCQTSSPPGLC